MTIAKTQFIATYLQPRIAREAAVRQRQTARGTVATTARRLGIPADQQQQTALTARFGRREERYIGGD